VIFTVEPEIRNSFWLFRDYVPAITELDSTAGAIDVDAIAELVTADRVEPILIPHDASVHRTPAFTTEARAVSSNVRCRSASNVLGRRSVGATDQPAPQRLAVLGARVTVVTPALGVPGDAVGYSVRSRHGDKGCARWSTRP
jgi:hypothetical protein